MPRAASDASDAAGTAWGHDYHRHHLDVKPKAAKEDGGCTSGMAVPGVGKAVGHKGRPCIPFPSSSWGQDGPILGARMSFSKVTLSAGDAEEQNPLPQAQRPHWWLLLHGGSQVHLPCNLGRQTHTCFLHKILHFLSCLYGWSFWLFVWCLKVRILERPIHLMEASEVLRNIGGPLLTVQIPSWSKRISTLVR